VVSEMAAGSVGPVVLLYSTDLMLLSSVSGAAQSLGVGFRSLRAVAEAGEQLRVAETVLCVDLASNVDVCELGAACSEAVLGRAIAFGPHVHVLRLEAARVAGFGLVVSRGQFVMQLLSLLSDRCVWD